VLAFGATYKVPTLAFRFFNVYGPLQSAGHAYAAAIPAFIDAALQERPLRVQGDGKQTRDFTFVGSVVRVLADAAERRVHGDRPVNLAFGSRTSLLELIKELENVIGRSLDIKFEPPREGDVRDSQAANDRLKELFPHCSPLSLKDGLAETLSWYRSRNDAIRSSANPPGQRTPASILSKA
jgi:UDP-glucose 4-epimerase